MEKNGWWLTSYLRRNKAFCAVYSLPPNQHQHQIKLIFIFYKLAKEGQLVGYAHWSTKYKTMLHTAFWTVCTFISLFLENFQLPIEFITLSLIGEEYLQRPENVQIFIEIKEDYGKNHCTDLYCTSLMFDSVNVTWFWFKMNWTNVLCVCNSISRVSP